MKDTQSRIEAAFDNTDPAYMQKSLAQRNPGPSSAGSTFLSPVTEEDLKAGPWEPANDPGIASPAEGFRTDIPGILGVCELSQLPENQKVKIQAAHAGAFASGGSSPAECVSVIPDAARKVDFTTLIIGPKGDVEVVYTFFPGPAFPKMPEVQLSDVQREWGVTDGPVEMTVADAENLGFRFCKHVNSL